MPHPRRAFHTRRAPLQDMCRLPGSSYGLASQSIVRHTAGTALLPHVVASLLRLWRLRGHCCCIRVGLAAQQAGRPDLIRSLKRVLAHLENKKPLLIVAICMPSLFHCSRHHVSFPGEPSPYPRRYSVAFDSYAASARSPTRWHSRVLFPGKVV